MTRVARTATRQTHQRTPADSATPWQELTSTSSTTDGTVPRVNKTKKKAGGQPPSTTGGQGQGPPVHKKKRIPWKAATQEASSSNHEVSSNFTVLGTRGDKSSTSTSKKVPKLVRIFGTFEVSGDEAARLVTLSKDLRARGFSRKEILKTIQAEKRKADRASRRRQDVTCFRCRQYGHSLHNCPNNVSSSNSSGSNGICFKCGSTEHSSRNCNKVKSDTFAHASCFICGKEGHISRQCGSNKNGIYPAGGCCNICKQTTHLAKDCNAASMDRSEGSSSKNNSNEHCLGIITNPYASTEYEPTSSTNSIKTNNKSNIKNRKKKKCIKF